MGQKDAYQTFEEKFQEQFFTLERQSSINSGLDTIVKIEDLLTLSECCTCTMKVTNLSNIYTTAVTLSPNTPDPPTCTPLHMQAILAPGAFETANGFTNSESGLFPGQPEFFILLASNAPGDGQFDCVNLRVEIDCGGTTTYDNSFTIEPHLPFNYYYVAQFDVDLEGQPTSCSLVSLDLSFKCRNQTNPNENCYPNCFSITSPSGEPNG